MCVSRCSGVPRTRRRAPAPRGGPDSGVADGRVGGRSHTRSQRLPQGRRVRRVIRKVDPWTVLRFSVLFYLSILLVVLVAGVALWEVASATGVRDNAENFVGELVGAGPATDAAGAVQSTTHSQDNNYRFRGSHILEPSAPGALA